MVVVLAGVTVRSLLDVVRPILPPSSSSSTSPLPRNALCAFASRLTLSPFALSLLLHLLRCLLCTLALFSLSLPALHRTSLASRASLPLVALRPPLSPFVPVHEALVVLLAPLQRAP